MLDSRIKLCFTLDMNPIERAVEAAGTQAQLAAAISVTPQAVSQWVSGIRPVPAERCIAIETATKGAVTRYELRADVFGEAPAPAAEPSEKAA